MQATSAEALPDTCRVVAAGAGDATYDPDANTWTPPASAVIYEGPVRLRPRGSQEQQVDSGDSPQTLGPYVATLPATAEAAGVTAGDPSAVAVDHTLEMLTSSDPALVGRPFRVVHVGVGTWHVARRLGLEDRQRPSGGTTATP